MKNKYVTTLFAVSSFNKSRDRVKLKACWCSLLKISYPETMQWEKKMRKSPQDDMSSPF